VPGHLEAPDLGPKGEWVEAQLRDPGGTSQGLGQRELASLPGPLGEALGAEDEKGQEDEENQDQKEDLEDPEKTSREHHGGRAPVPEGGRTP
jgi:hypothetical protein